MPIIFFSLKTRMRKNMMLTSTKRYLILSKIKGHTQYLGIIQLFNAFRLANLYK